MLPPMAPEIVEFPNETRRDIPDALRERLSARSMEDVAATSQRSIERSQLLREAHINAVKERAARETQRGEEAAARKRRREALCAAVKEAHGMQALKSVQHEWSTSMADDALIKEAERERRAALAPGMTVKKVRR